MIEKRRLDLPDFHAFHTSTPYRLCNSPHPFSCFLWLQGLGLYCQDECSPFSQSSFKLSTQYVTTACPAPLSRIHKHFIGLCRQLPNSFVTVHEVDKPAADGYSCRSTTALCKEQDREHRKLYASLFNMCH